MKLSKLLKKITANNVALIKAETINRTTKKTLPDCEITSIHYNAQDVKNNGLFVAISGITADGHDFINEAIERGASVIIVQKPIDTICQTLRENDKYQNLIIIEVENSRKTLAIISANFFGDPSEKLFVIGITGTNGKTTTAFLIEKILVEAGFNVGVIGTIGCHYSGKTLNNPLTTPESADLQNILSKMLDSGVTHVVMEVSSHAIALNRIDCCWIDIGVFTNLTQDHLDYHKDINSYWECKKSFFTDNLSSGPKKNSASVIINCDDLKGKELAEILTETKLKIFKTSLNSSLPICAKNIKYSKHGIDGEISTSDETFKFQSHLVGKYNLENILCAVGVGKALNLSCGVIASGIQKLSYVPGRLESIANDKNRFVYVDYAHTPDALENVIRSLKSISIGRIICVFGCGGNRDKDKRSKMGKIAGELCDFVVITSDNSRKENCMDIINQILDGIKTTKLQYYIEPDRKKAIYIGITTSKPGDTILIAGKGHETYQITGNEVAFFDDRKEAEAILELL